jgi:hypothetical protein
LREAEEVSIWDCIDRARSEFEADAERAADVRARFKRMADDAQAAWKWQSDQYESMGFSRHNAEQMAGDDIREAFRRKAGEERHNFISHMGAMRRIEADVSQRPNETLNQRVERAGHEATGLFQSFAGRLNKYYSENHRAWQKMGALTNPERVRNVTRELWGEQTGDVVAAGFAKEIRAILEELRIKLNDMGANIGELDNYAFRHQHDTIRISQVGFDVWGPKIDKLQDWTKIRDPFTDRPMQGEGMPPPSEQTRMRFLKEVYDNMVFGKDSLDPSYTHAGSNIATQNSRPRVLHFKSPDAWLEYQTEFGVGSPHSAITGQIYSMVRDYTHMRAFGRSPQLGINYSEALRLQKARKAGDEKAATAIKADAELARKQMRILRGLSAAGDNSTRAHVARFMASTRMVLSSAHLDRAIWANLSDANTLHLAAKVNNLRGSDSPITRQIGLAKMMSRDDLLRAKHTMDSWTDAGGVMERWSHDTQPHQWADTLGFMSMKAQGLIDWTDRARRNYAELEWRNMAVDAHLPFDQIDQRLRTRLSEFGLTAKEWDMLRDPAHMFRTADGATFLIPTYWRESVRGIIPDNVADDILVGAQGMIASGTEMAIPTQSTMIRAFVGEGDDSLPGSPIYELRKSALAYKSFPMAFMRNQYRALMSMPDNPSRWQYGAYMLATTTVAGAVALQIADLTYGRDPQPMFMDGTLIPDLGFWGRAMLRGGGLGILGDLVVAGEGSFGGGMAEFFAGPVVGLGQDLYKLGPQNVGELVSAILTGEPVKTGFAKELGRFGKRYTPLGDTPLIGPFGRMFWDYLTILMDPEAVESLQKVAQRREQTHGNAEWWPSLSPAPKRLPDLTSAFGR